MISELIASKSPNHLIPKDWLQKAVETHNTAIGFAVPKDGKILHMNFDPTKDDLLKSVQMTQEKFKGEHVFMYFAHADKDDKFGIDSYQPMVVLSKGNDTLMAVLMEGDFSEYADKGANSPAKNMFDGYLKEKLTEMYGDLGNLDKFMTRVDGAPFRKDMMPNLNPRGYMMILPARGKAIAFGSNLLGQSYTWGSASKSLDFPSDLGKETADKTVVVDTVATAPKKLTFAEQKAREKALKESKGEKVEETKLDQTTTKPGQARDSAGKPKPPFYMNGDVMWIKPLAGTTHKDAAIWWSRHTKLPKPRADSPESLFAGFPITNLASDSPFFQFLAEGDRPANPEPSALKDALDKATQKKKESAKAETDADNTPGVITPAEKQGIIRDRGEQHLWGKTIEEILDLAKPNLLFSEQTQVPFTDLLHAAVGFYFRRSKRELISLILEYRKNVIENRKMLEAHGVVFKEPEAPVKKEELPFVPDPVKTPEKVVSPSGKKLTFAEIKAAQRKAA